MRNALLPAFTVYRVNAIFHEDADRSTQETLSLFVACLAPWLLAKMRSSCTQNQFSVSLDAAQIRSMRSSLPSLIILPISIPHFLWADCCNWPR